MPRPYRSTHARTTPILLALLAGCGSDVERPLADPPGEPTGQVRISAPAWLDSLATEVTGTDGTPLRLRCESCHALSPSGAALPASAEEAGAPHTGLEVEHGTLACASCHDSERPDRLRLASGHVAPMREAMLLCAQCHGTQHRDYQHGAHGGMQGYWDLSRGDRVRNHCVECHAPHRPAYPRLRPLPPPHDRFPPVRHEGDHG
ncbi:MAG: hypothetical protein KF729_19745 [Sandaracinaceae bacterium]|nr:hypothetical protein [Sandaracinaceae bacterium]